MVMLCGARRLPPKYSPHPNAGLLDMIITSSTKKPSAKKKMERPAFNMFKSMHWFSFIVVNLLLLLIPSI